MIHATYTYAYYDGCWCVRQKRPRQRNPGVPCIAWAYELHEKHWVLEPGSFIVASVHVLKHVCSSGYHLIITYTRSGNPVRLGDHTKGRTGGPWLALWRDCGSVKYVRIATSWCGNDRRIHGSLNFQFSFLTSSVHFWPIRLFFQIHIAVLAPCIERHRSSQRSCWEFFPSAFSIKFTG